MQIEGDNGDEWHVWMLNAMHKTETGKSRPSFGSRPSSDWRRSHARSILPTMETHEQPPSIRVGTSPDGSVTYLVAVPPEALPPVAKRDLELAWHAARRAALGQRWGVVRGFRFNRPDGTHTDLALADPDADCWVAALDLSVGLGTSHGMSLCLRLLALIELLAHATWARPLFTLDRGGADLHPALLRTAATIPLTRDARFDEAGFRLRLSRYVAGFALEAPRNNTLGDTAPLGA